MLCELPFINNRETIVHGYPINRLDIDDSFILCCKSITDDIGIKIMNLIKCIEFLKKYDINLPQTNNVQIDIKFFTLQAKIINKNS